MLEKWLGWIETATLYDAIIEEKHLKGYVFYEPQNLRS